jgi:MFS family permease
LTGGYSFAAAVGYILGGYLADTGDWRAVFYVTATYAVLLLPLMLLVLPPTRRAPGGGRFDLLGALMFAPSVAAVLYGITTASKEGWRAAQAWIPVAAGAAVIAVWAWHELRLKDPLINLRLLRRREILVGNLCAAFASAGVMQLPLVTLLLFQQPPMLGVGLGVSATMAGLLKLPSNIGSLIASPLGGWVSGKHGSRWAMIQGALICVAGWLSLYVLHDTLVQVTVGTVICAFGSSVLLSSIPNLVLEGAPLERSSEVTGLTTVFRSMAAGVGAQVITILLATSQVSDPTTGASYPAESAYQLTFLSVAASALLVAVIALGVPARRAAVLEPDPGARRAAAP